MGNSSMSNQITVGTDVYASDGDKVGTVSSIGADYAVVEKGFLFPTDYYIPTSAIARVDGGKAYLNVGRDAAVNSTWGQQPSTGSWSATVTAADDYVTTTTAGARNLPSNQQTPIQDGEDLVVQVHEEELVATKTAQEAGEVVISKSVVEEARTIEVPITEERVNVTRRVVDRDATPDATAFQGGTIEVPLMTEQVNLQKQVRVSEEIEIDREAVQTTQQVQGTVRKEVVDVSEVQTDTTIQGTNS